MPRHTRLGRPFRPSVEGKKKAGERFLSRWGFRAPSLPESVSPAPICRSPAWRGKELVAFAVPAFWTPAPVLNLA